MTPKSWVTNMNSHNNTLAPLRLAIQTVVDAFDKLPARHSGRMARLHLNGLRDAVNKINAAQVCEHEWVPAINKVVESGYVCFKCNAISAEPTPKSVVEEEPTTLLVVWSIKIGNQVTDHWTACEDKQAALDKYNKLCETDGIYSVSICKPVRSTDY